MLYEWEAPETADGLQELLQHSADDQATARSVTRGSPEARPDAARSRGAPDRARQVPQHIPRTMSYFHLVTM